MKIFNIDRRRIRLIVTQVATFALGLIVGLHVSDENSRMRHGQETVIKRCPTGTIVKPHSTDDDGSQSIPKHVKRLLVSGGQVPIQECLTEMLRKGGGEWTGMTRTVRSKSVIRLGRIKIVILTTSWCEPCKEFLKQLSGRTITPGVDIIVINVDGGAIGNYQSTIKSLGDAPGWVFISRADREYVWAKAIRNWFGEVGYPSILLVGADNVILDGWQGSHQSIINTIIARSNEMLVSQEISSLSDLDTNICVLD